MNIEEQRDALLVLIDTNEARIEALGADIDRIVGQRDKFIELVDAKNARIEALEAALREIEWHDPKSPAAAAARAALDKDAGEAK